MDNSAATDTVGTARVGVTGLAVMGSNLARNLAGKGFVTAVHNRSYAKTQALIAEHGSDGRFVPSESMSDFVASLQRPRTAIIMVKAGAPTDAVIDELAALMEPGDIIIDGGNAHFPDTRRREEYLRSKSLHFVGCGISGGEEGALKGPSIMPGGSAESYRTVGPILETISAHVDGEPCCTHIGTDGAGHFVKMVHNGIEYGLMQAYAEGFSIMKHKAELGLDLAQVAEIWRQGSVVRSWLLDLTARALEENPSMDDIAPYVPDSGEGRWTVAEAIALDVPAPVITLALLQRLRSRDAESYGDRLLSALRNQFGGHAMKAEPSTPPGS